jgi:hypothetical protein
MTPNVTIVSACDRNFIWGAYLLAASVAKEIPGVPMHLLQTGFTEEDIRMIEQFPGIKVLPLADGDKRNVSNRKAEAILSAVDSEFIAWLDADCMVIGDVRELLIPENGEFQIRLREVEENGWVWNAHYEPGDTFGKLPKAVESEWQRDVGEREEARTQMACVANAFVLHQRHLPFIRKWQAQIQQVLPSNSTKLVDKSSMAYFMIDESVLSSLIAFSHEAPPISPLRLNRIPERHVAHFGSTPKPWQRWRKQLWYCYPHIIELLEWARKNGYAMPPLPPSFDPKNRLSCHAQVLWGHWRQKIRTIGGKLLKKK